MKNIFNNSEDFDNDISTPSRRFSVSSVINVEENDDTQEKRAKRKSMMVEIGSANILTNNQNLNINQKFELPTGYSEDEIVKHYGNCIKLASENKITLKNAFNLYLIDYLSSYTKDMENFQKVGSSLDAGNKIYASRVDSIHQNTYQVLTGLGNEPDGNVLPNEERDSVNDPNIGEPQIGCEDDETGTKSKKTKRKVNTIKKTITQNLKKIRINAAQIRSEVDPLFQSQAENFDEGGNFELRCNNLRLLDRTYEFLLDSEKIVCTNTTEDHSSNENNMETEWFDISSFRTSLEEIKNGPIQISELFEDFLFTGWNESSETMNSTAAESFRNMIINATKKEDQLTNQDDNDVTMVNDDFVEDYGNDFVNNNDLLEYNKIMAEEVVEDDDDNLVTIGSSKVDSCVGNVLMSSVRGMVNSFVEHYGEMNDNMLGMWAGPLYWKQKGKPLKALKTGEDKRAAPRAKPTKENKPLFPEIIETRLNECGVGRLVSKTNWSFIKSELPSTQLTDVCLNKNVKKECILPPRTHFSLKSLNQLMNREVSLVNKVLRNQANLLPSSELNNDEKMLNYDYNKADDILEFCPQDPSLVTDNDGNVTVQNHDLPTGFEIDDDCSDKDVDTICNSFNDIGFNGIFSDQEPVTANVRRVDQIDLNYAKRDKRINVVKLKSEIWSTLKQSIKAADIATIHEKKYPNVHKAADSKTLLFSELLCSFNHKIADEASKDLSSSILVTCLLLLANETGLDISSNEEFSDLHIGQGYSDYDLQQISLFGKGNSLFNTTRKRKTFDSIQSRTFEFSDMNNDDA